MKIDKLMTSCPGCATADTPIAEVAKMMVEHDCGQIPVLGGDSGRKPIGVVTDRDIVVRAVAAARNPLDLKASDCMSSPCTTVKVDCTLEECCNVMESKQIRRVLVVDDNGDLAGIVAQADIARTGETGQTAEVVKKISAA